MITDIIYGLTVTCSVILCYVSMSLAPDDDTSFHLIGIGIHSILSHIIW